MSSSMMLTSTVSDERDALALHAAHELGVLLAVARGEVRLAIVRVRLEHRGASRASTP